MPKEPEASFRASQRVSGKCAGVSLTLISIKEQKIAVSRKNSVEFTVAERQLA
jgi:hypothetical protein